MRSAVIQPLQEYAMFALSQDCLALLEQYAKTTGDKTALFYHDKSMTYLQLNQRVNQMAHMMQQQLEGKPHDAGTHFIAVIGDNKLEMLIAELAILKIGAAFVPVDIAVPTERLAYMMTHARISMIINCCEDILPATTQAALTELSAQQLQFKEIPFSGFPMTNPNIQIDEQAAAYLLFTSGSTGSPKAVVQTRAGLKTQIHRYSRDLKIDAQDCLLQLSNYVHDQAILDLYAGLFNGATLALYDSQNIHVKDLQQFISDKKVSIFSAIPSIFQLVFADFPQAKTLGHLRIVTTEGEETHLSHAELYQAVCPDHCLLINGYGATECSWIAFYTISKSTDLSQMTSIPLGNITEGLVYQLVPVEGDASLAQELWICGDGVSPGYWRNEVANQHAYVPQPGDKPFYKTGDRVAVTESELTFKGRAQWHEKIRGQRVNLHEIQQTMMRLFELTDCVVLTTGSDQTKKIIAFFNTSDISEDVMREKLAASLPSYMMPSDLLALDEFPRLASGKIDTSQLKQRQQQTAFTASPSASDFPEGADLSTLPSYIKSLWAATLDMPVSMETHFIRNGGDSLSATRLVNQVVKTFEQRYKTNCPTRIAAFIRCQTLQEFVKLAMMTFCFAEFETAAAVDVSGADIDSFEVFIKTAYDFFMSASEEVAVFLDIEQSSLGARICPYILAYLEKQLDYDLSGQAKPQRLNDTEARTEIAKIKVENDFDKIKQSAIRLLQFGFIYQQKIILCETPKAATLVPVEGILGTGIYLTTHERVLALDYTRYCKLAEHYNRELGLNIKPCNNWREFITKMLAAIENNIYQTGLTIPSNMDGNGECHHIPCVLHIDPETKAITLFASDSVGNSLFESCSLNQALAVFTEENPQYDYKVYVDECTRQLDSDSCFIDSLCFFKMALSINMKEKSAQFSGRSLALSEAERGVTGVSALPSWADGSFLCPPEVMVISQRNIPARVNMAARLQYDLIHDATRDLNQRTFADVRAHYWQSVQYTLGVNIFDDDNTAPATTSVERNTYLFAASKAMCAELLSLSKPAIAAKQSAFFSSVSAQSDLLNYMKQNAARGGNATMLLQAIDHCSDAIAQFDQFLLELIATQKGREHLANYLMTRRDERELDESTAFIARHSAKLETGLARHLETLRPDEGGASAAEAVKQSDVVLQDMGTLSGAMMAYITRLTTTVPSDASTHDTEQMAAVKKTPAYFVKILGEETVQKVEVIQWNILVLDLKRKLAAMAGEESPLPRIFFGGKQYKDNEYLDGTVGIYDDDPLHIIFRKPSMEKRPSPR